MKNKLLVLFSLCMIILPIVSADVISPGFHGIPVYNNITNIRDFPDYVFVSGGEIGPEMCPMKIIDNNGMIDPYYKFCGVFVYAIPKDKFDVEIINEINNNSMITKEAKDLLLGLSATKVIEGIRTYEEVSDVSPIKGKLNEYIIDINQLKESPDKINETISPVKKKPDNIITDKSDLIYVYIIVPIVALLVIILILVKRKKK
jgi:hypothetical protein